MILRRRTTRRDRASVLNAAALTLALLLALGCNRPAADAEPEPEQAPDRIALAQEGPRFAGPPSRTTAREPSPALADAPDLADDKKEDEADDEEQKDYWAKIDFTSNNFEEVREYVKTYYIDETVDESRAFVEAANFAMLEFDPPHELLPVAFYEARKDSPEEEGRLSGKTYRIDKSDKFLVHVIPSEEELEKLSGRDPKKRLTDDEIREKREQAKKRREQLEAEWSKIPFAEKQFKEVMAHVSDRVKKGQAGKDKKDIKKFYVAAAQGYLYSLDPHSSLVSAEAWDESTKNTTDSSFEGIGAILTQRNEETIVESPLEGRPAHEAGVRAGDKIIKVDGKDIIGMPLHKVVKHIRGPKGTTVKLSVLREGDPEEKVFPIKRAHIEITNVSGRLLEPHHPGIAYVKVTGFVPESAKDVEETLDSLKTEHAKLHDGADLRGVILDLRNNSGGLLQQGVKIADMFVKKGTIVEVRNRMQRNEVYKAKAEGTWDLPVIVLVNDGSASASEIVASAIQDNGEGLLVGDRTFGKASVQTLFSPILRKDYYIKLTIARYFSPSGRTIQVVGVTPDFDVPPDVGGDMPLGFREENLSHYLKPIDAAYKQPDPHLIKKVADCTELRGIAERIHANDPKPQIKFDYQLYKAADYMECYADQLKMAGR